jgi:hypothetical protein
MMDDDEEYKGIFYDKEEEQKFYEGGAHFSYIELYNVLEKFLKIKKEEKKNKKKGF